MPHLVYRINHNYLVHVTKIEDIESKWAHDFSKVYLSGANLAGAWRQLMTSLSLPGLAQRIPVSCLLASILRYLLAPQSSALSALLSKMTCGQMLCDALQHVLVHYRCWAVL